MRHAAALGGGIVFGLGMAVSGLAKQEVVLSFLQLRDLGLAVLMAAAVAVAMPIYQFAPRKLPAPLLGGGFDKPGGAVRPPHIVGGLIFGVGWGISGVCPGAATTRTGCRAPAWTR